MDPGRWLEDQFRLKIGNFGGQTVNSPEGAPLSVFDGDVWCAAWNMFAEAYPFVDSHSEES